MVLIFLFVTHYLQKILFWMMYMYPCFWKKK